MFCPRSPCMDDRRVEHELPFVNFIAALTAEVTTFCSSDLVKFKLNPSFRFTRLLFLGTRPTRIRFSKRVPRLQKTYGNCRSLSSIFFIAFLMFRTSRIFCFVRMLHCRPWHRLPDFFKQLNNFFHFLFLHAMVMNMATIMLPTTTNAKYIENNIHHRPLRVKRLVRPNLLPIG